MKACFFLLVLFSVSAHALVKNCQYSTPIEFETLMTNNEVYISLHGEYTVDANNYFLENDKFLFAYALQSETPRRITNDFIRVENINFQDSLLILGPERSSLISVISLKSPKDVYASEYARTATAFTIKCVPKPIEDARSILKNTLNGTSCENI